jgi:hypothetical protein
MTTKPCIDCPDDTFAESADDDRFLRFMQEDVIKALTPRSFVVTVNVNVAPDLEQIESLMKQFQTAQKGPDGDEIIESIKNVLADMRYNLDIFEREFRADLPDIIKNPMSRTGGMTEINNFEVKIEPDERGTTT